MRRVYYDVTHLRHNALRDVNSGIRRIDLEFASYFFARGPETRAIQYGVAGPSLLPYEGQIDRIVARMRERIRIDDLDRSDQISLEALRIRARERARSVGGSGPTTQDLISYARFLTWPSRTTTDVIARDAVYINVAQHALAYGFFFRWLKARPDIRSVFFVHDLMPLDYPEFWRDGYQEQFIKGMNNLADVGRAFLVSTEAVRDRLAHELRKRGRAQVPILALPFPAFRREPPPTARAAGAVPYFIMVGTIEPRKNHLLILHVWRRLAAAGGAVPTLILVGRRGWENEQVVDMLDRCAAIRPHVIEAADLSDPDMRRLVANASALLYPSFDEGFGLPLAEALAAGTPVIASDIKVLRETAQDKAIFLDPLDGPGWLEAILKLSDPEGPSIRSARALAATYAAPAPAPYFETIEAFVQTLP